MKMKITGTILKRRSMGKSLAFAEVQISNILCDNNDDDNDDDGDINDDRNNAKVNISSEDDRKKPNTILKVAFRKASAFWNPNDIFPSKASSLPYGALVEMELVMPTGTTNSNIGEPNNNNNRKRSSSNGDSVVVIQEKEQTEEEAEEKHKDECAKIKTSQHQILKKNQMMLWEVCSWKILVNPSDEAKKAAQQEDGHGVSCSIYLRSRRNAFSNARSQWSPSSSSSPLHENSPSTILCRRRSLDAGAAAHKTRSSSSSSMLRSDDANNKKPAARSDKKCNNDRQHHYYNIVVGGGKLVNGNNNDDWHSGHGGASYEQAKALRAKIFAQWIADTLLLCLDNDDLKNNNNTSEDGSSNNKGVCILDIAGGKGQLSVELSLLVPPPSTTTTTTTTTPCCCCTVIDPLIRKNGILSSKQKKRLLKANRPFPKHLARCFDSTNFLQQDDDNDDDGNEGKKNQHHHQTLFAEATCLVGLHPDECTEDIVDMALRYGKSVAVVPCCVFPTLFPHRRLRNGDVVEHYESFLQYLLEKDARLGRETLPFEGRNQVIYYNAC